MRSTADVIIIGAGVIGCSAAYHLAAAGIRDVVVLEMGQIGSGTSSKSAAMLTMQFCRDALTARLSKQAYAAYMNFEETLGAPVDFRKTGWLTVATAEAADELAASIELLHAEGITTDTLGQEDIQRLCPELNTDDLVLGTWGPDDGSLDPHMVMSGYVQAARRLGATFYEGLRARDILVEQGQVRGVATDRGAIAAAVVVNAAGPWAAEVGRWVGVDIPLHNASRTIVVTQPLAAIPPERPFVEDMAAGWYFRPEMDGVLMGMGLTPAAAPDVPLDEAQVAAIIETAVYRVPVMAQAAMRTAWTGVRPLTRDDRPIVGWAPGLDGFLLNCGWGGMGIIMAPIAGPMIVACLTEGQLDGEVGPAVSPARFQVEL